MEQRGIRRLSDMADRSGVSYPTILKLYHDEAAGITWPVLAAVCTALGIGPGELLHLEGNATGVEAEAPTPVAPDGHHPPETGQVEAVSEDDGGLSTVS